MSSPNITPPGHRPARKRLSIKKDPPAADGIVKPNSHGPTPIDRHPREAMIRNAAYLRAEGRGFAPGLEIQDWLEAEAEVDRKLANGVGSAGV
jgi:hypothetical protein